ncbi:restriction endonuclease subunit S [Leuconostoc mesenteroides]|uniref:restriction endonuclease subunit S n=1 Tax=Leuconostoc mesenteroides TaxID=1245 RepID=UPI00235DF402|nr:restriction endonuclease subunit S [Leuconostoc mesenteroides]
MSKKTPQIRFKGFTDDWEVRKLKDISEIIDGDRGKNYPSGDDFKNNGHTLFLSATNVTKQGFVFKKNQYITNLKSESLGNGKVKLNDIILTSRGSIGHIGFYDEKTNEKIPQARINSGMLILRTDKFNSPNFIAQFLKSPLGIKQIKLISFGSAQPQLTKKDIKKFKIALPKIEEQQKIGSLLKQIDNTIALHQRKLDLLKEQKKGYLQKMFPKNGAKVPELRFAGFADDWEERKLEELTLVLTGFPFKNEDFVDNGKYLVITNGNIQNESSTVDVSLGNRVDDLSDEIKERYYLNKNDILVTMDGTVGRTAKVVDDNMILAQRVARLVANKNTEFVYQWLNQGSFFNEMTKVSHGGTIKHISLNEISNYSATVPSNNIEQQKIGSFFKQLDDTIALHQRKLDLLKEQKKGFLQKMFIS